jgi:hypothetical protein
VYGRKWRRASGLGLLWRSCWIWKALKSVLGRCLGREWEVYTFDHWGSLGTSPTDDEHFLLLCCHGWIEEMFMEVIDYTQMDLRVAFELY